LTDPDSSYEIPVIVVATVAAVLVIAIAAFFLVKVGNFRRKYIKCESYTHLFFAL
jgi:hypothetical protein